MKILGYDEVDSQQVLELNLRCFGWFLTSDQVKLIRKVDKRVPDYFALYAVEKGEVQSQVGAVAVDTQTTSGIQKIGYIWAVGTNPITARKGLAKKLMEETHARLTDEGIRYSCLGTAKSLVAYHLYKGLGYKDFANLDWGLKACEPKQEPEIDVTLTLAAKEDTLYELFTKYSSNLLGFVHRPKNFLQVRKAWSWMSLNMVGVFEKDNKLIGYILASREGKVIRIRELCCPKIQDMQSCIKAMEMRFKPDHFVFEWIAGTYVTESFVNSGFKHIPKSWGILMFKNLKGRDKIKDIQKSYGLKEKKFHMTSIDEY